VDRRNQIFLTSQYLVRPNKSSHLYTKTRIGHLSYNSRTFIKRLNFLLFLYLIFFVVCEFLFFVLLTSP
jgi:hypothetical protein